MNEMNGKKAPTAHTKRETVRKVLSILIIVALVLMIPVFIYNSIFLVKKATAKDNKPPAMLGYVSQYIPSDEFEPFNMKKGDLILIKKVDPADVQVGDIISFMKNAKDDTIVIQKVDKILTNSNGELVGWEILDFNGFKSQVLINSLVGEYNGNRIPVIGGIANFMGTPWGIAICLIVPLGLLVACEVATSKKKEKDADADKAELLAELEALRKAKAEAERTEPPTDAPAEAPTEEAPEEDTSDKAE